METTELYHGVNFRAFFENHATNCQAVSPSLGASASGSGFWGPGSWPRPSDPGFGPSRPILADVVARHACRPVAPFASTAPKMPLALTPPLPKNRTQEPCLGTRMQSRAHGNWQLRHVHYLSAPVVPARHAGAVGPLGDAATRADGGVYRLEFIGRQAASLACPC